MNIYDYINYIDLIGWIGNFCFVIGGLLLAKKKVFGWTYQILGNMSYLLQGLFLSVTSLWILSCLLIGMNIYGIVQWQKKPEKILCNTPSEIKDVIMKINKGYNNG